MDEKEVVEGVSRNEGRHGLSGIADLSNVRDLLTIDDYSLEGSPPDTQDLFNFLSMYEENARKEPKGKLLLGKFIPFDYLRALEYEIIQEKRGRFRHHYL